MLYFSHGYASLWLQRLKSVVDYLQESGMNLEKAPPEKLTGERICCKKLGARYHSTSSEGSAPEVRGAIFAAKERD